MYRRIRFGTLAAPILAVLLGATVASSCGEGGGDPYVNLRDSPLLSDLPPDALALEVECRRIKEILAPDHFSCSRSYATNLELQEIRLFYLWEFRTLGYEVSADGPQGQTSSRYIIGTILEEDISVTARIRDPFTHLPEFAERRWTVVVAATEYNWR